MNFINRLGIIVNSIKLIYKERKIYRVISIAITLYIFLSILVSCSPAFPAIFKIEDEQITSCNDDIPITTVEAGKDACIIWTEVGRKNSETLTIYIYGLKNPSTPALVKEAPYDTTSNELRKRNNITIPNNLEPDFYRVEFIINGQQNDDTNLSFNIISNKISHSLNGEIGCIGLEPTIFFQGDDNSAIENGKFMIEGKGSDYGDSQIILVEISGIFNGKSISSGEILMYRSYQENGNKFPFRTDAFEGTFENFTLYSEPDRVTGGGCTIFIKIHIENPISESTPMP